MKTRKITKKEVLHLKTGNIYEELGRAFDCTNGFGDERKMVIYTNGILTFVREENEFDEKFVAIPT